MFKNISAVIKKYCPIPSIFIFCITIFSVFIHILCVSSATFSDKFNLYISSFFRGILSSITDFLPFSIAETIILFLPILFIIVLVICFKKTKKGTTESARFLCGFASVAALLYSLFVFTTVAGYNSTSLSDKLMLEDKPVSLEDLKITAEFFIDKTENELEEINFVYGKNSLMPYSIDKMNEHLMNAYKKASEKYSFIPDLNSRIKPIALSELMTYTHISGIYTFYTGEANLNVNFPDYCLPFTAAHELAHQRGILPENEANFVAFLVCSISDDPYIRYSGYLNMYEYLNSAIYSEDYEVFKEIFLTLDIRIRGEMNSYNEFFKKYRDNYVADISTSINDAYLKAQGQSAGEKSYGMVVDLACAYVKSLSE